MRNATRITVSSIGALMGIAGIEHGVGEMLQGNVAPGGLMIQSWPESDFFRIVGGEPAMTVVPSLLVTGMLAVFLSLAYLVWATRFVQRRNGGLVLSLLAMLMLLFGGGIFPPVIGIVLGIIGTQILAPLSWWRTTLPAQVRDALTTVWPWSFALCLLAWLALFPGINLLAYFLGLNDPTLTVLLILLAFGSLVLATVSGFAYDIGQQTGHPKPTLASRTA